MLILENIKIAFRSIKSNLLRSLLTILIITVGITALVGILTAIDVMLNSLNSNFSSIGTNSFKIRPSYEKDIIHVRTWTEVYKKSASLRKYEFFNQNQELLAKAETVYVCIDATSLRPVKIPENVLSFYM